MLRKSLTSVQECKFSNQHAFSFRHTNTFAFHQVPLIGPLAHCADGLWQEKTHVSCVILPSTSQSSVVSIPTILPVWTVGGFESWEEQEIFLYSKPSRPALRPKILLFSRCAAFFSVVKRSGLKLVARLYLLPTLRIHGATRQRLYRVDKENSSYLLVVYYLKLLNIKCVTNHW